MRRRSSLELRNADAEAHHVQTTDGLSTPARPGPTSSRPEIRRRESCADQYRYARFMGLESLLQSLDPSASVRGHQFEHVTRWFLLNAPEYRHLFKEVWLWDEWPGRWGPDSGIDLVAQEHGGDLWAIQAKAYDAAYSIKKADVDSFLSEASRRYFTYRLLIATTDLLGARARATIEREGNVGLLLRSQLEAADVTWPRTPRSEAPAQRAPKVPLPHACEAIKDITAGLASRPRAQAIMASGTGKTLVGLWVAERLEAQRILVLVPSLSLLAQTLREWTANASEGFNFLPVCSDESVSHADELLASTAELGLPVTTSPDVVARFFADEHGRRVVFATYQSSPVIAAAFGLRPNLPELDLVIADEAHRTVGSAGSVFGTILDDCSIRAKRRLFMTATPRVFTERATREAVRAGQEIMSMSDEDAYGPVVHRLTFGQAITRKLLADYQVLVIGVDRPDHWLIAEKRRLVELHGRVTDAATLAAHVGLARAVGKYDLRHIVSFHSRVAGARDFSTNFPLVVDMMLPEHRPAGETKAVYVSGLMSSGRRDALLRQFRAEQGARHKVISNARCLVEGINVPGIDGVAFIDARHSTIDIIQAVGRAIRRSPDKKLGTIIVPVFVPVGSRAEEVLENSSFAAVWAVLRALRAHDETLAEELDAARRELGRRPSQAPRRPAKIVVNLPSELDDVFLRSFDTRLVKATTTPWLFGVGVLQRYVDDHGTASLEKQVVYDGFELGSWVASQRGLYRSGQLSERRRLELEALPGWTWSAYESRWEQHFAALAAYAEREGHATVPLAHVEGQLELGKWVVQQREWWGLGKMQESREQRLEQVPGWVWETPDHWTRTIQLLETFARREGHTRVPVSHMEDGFKLGRWVRKQRLTLRDVGPDAEPWKQDRRVYLDGLPGWTWRPYTDAWEDAFRILCAYVDREGHARVPSSHIEEGFKLGRWVETQRGIHRLQRRGSLDGGRRQRLEALPQWTWDPRDTQWDDGFSSLLAYVAREGHARVPGGHLEAGFPLGAWVTKQKQEFHRGAVSAGRSARLNDVPGWAWNAKDAEWDDRFMVLKRYAAREGHTRVPSAAREGGFRLGTWVASQRSAYAKGRLSERARTRLESLAQWSWSLK